MSEIIDEPEEDLTVVNRYVPESLEVLCQRTQYRPREIQLIYRAFKQECPTGIVYEQQFKELYGQYFPLGDAKLFAGLVFSNLDRDQNGWVTFEQFLVNMSLLTRGTLMEKLRWVFNLYDLNGDGQISPDELTSVIMAVHSLLGTHTEPAFRDLTVRSHVERIFAKMDEDGDGQISAEEFMASCLKDPQIQRSLCGLFDSSF